MAERPETLAMAFAAAATLAQLRRLLRRAARQAGDAEGTLQAATLLGAINWQANDGQLSEEALEAGLAVHHGAAVAAAAATIRAGAVDWLHVISESYDHGGHALLLLNLAEELARRGARQAVAVTRRPSGVFAARLAAAGVEMRVLTGSLVAKAAGVLAHGRSAGCTVLHIHPDDAGAALAARLLRTAGRRVLFVNHADHVFSYGPGAADATLEVSGIGWRLTAARRTTRAQGFLGIPVPVPATPGYRRRDGPIVSMGAWDKYQPGGGLSFPDFLLDLLPRTDRMVELIGPSGTEPWWSAVRARYSGRVRFCGPLPFPEAAVRLAEAGAYVDSFPRNGGTAFPQALLAGCTVFGPGGAEGGYGLAEVLRSPSLEAMTRELLRFLADGVEPPLQAEVRRRLTEDFNAAVVTDRLIAAAAGSLSPVPGELAAARRDLDYHVRIWQERGQVHVGLGTADRIPATVRREIAVRVLGRKQVTRHPGGWKPLLRWAATGKAC